MSNETKEATEKKHYLELGIVAFLSLLPILALVATKLQSMVIGG